MPRWANGTSVDVAVHYNTLNTLHSNTENTLLRYILYPIWGDKIKKTTTTITAVWLHRLLSHHQIYSKWLCNTSPWWPRRTHQTDNACIINAWNPDAVLFKMYCNIILIKVEEKKRFERIISISIQFSGEAWFENGYRYNESHKWHHITQPLTPSMLNLRVFINTNYKNIKLFTSFARSNKMDPSVWELDKQQ